ncbi:MAG: type IV toxin-antitoxin system AbiEi family antitoxin domain-containing protein [Deltaproteobacteria bacterium]|nr:type IV toxin-antitoxin system AbiEi family antitoxin domain-containing protein [Deltaproteobacteria bacterium]
MSADRTLRMLRQYRTKQLFRLADFATLLGTEERTLRVELSRLVARGLVERVSHGLYANPFNPPGPDELAMALKTPAYLSLESALSRRGVLSQDPAAYTLVTTAGTYTFESRGRVFEYHHIQRAYFTGYTREGTLLLAEPEKALADLVYLRHARTRELGAERLASLVEDMDLNRLRPGGVRRYARMMGVEERIGAFLG